MECDVVVSNVTERCCSMALSAESASDEILLTAIWKLLSARQGGTITVEGNRRVIWKAVDDADIQ